MSKTVVKQEDRESCRRGLYVSHSHRKVEGRRVPAFWLMVEGVYISSLSIESGRRIATGVIALEKVVSMNLL